MSAPPSNSVVQQFIIQAESFTPSPNLAFTIPKQMEKKLFWLGLTYKSKREGAYTDYFEKHLSESEDVTENY